MSERGAEMLREEMEFQPPQRRSVVEEAQGRIVAVVRRLEESGAILISRGGDQDQMMSRTRAMAQPYMLERPRARPPRRRPRSATCWPCVEAARAEADAIREQARAEGLAEGRAAGAAAALEEARAQLAPAVQALADAAEALASARAEVADRVEAGAVALALELAEKVVGGAVQAQPERVVDVVRGALRCLVERERIQVLVNPDDLAIVRESIDAVTGELGGIQHVEVLEERRIGRGGAIVRTPDGEIDAALSTKLERAREVVAAELGAS